MSELTFNFGPAPDSVEPGEYAVRIIKTSRATSSAGNDMLVITFESKDGVRFTDRIVEKDTVRWRAASLWSACGLELPRDGRVDAGVLIGKRLAIVVDLEEFKGELRPKVDGYMTLAAESDIPETGAGEFVHEPADDDDTPFA